MKCFFWFALAYFSILIYICSLQSWEFGYIRVRELSVRERCGETIVAVWQNEISANVRSIFCTSLQVSAGVAWQISLFQNIKMIKSAEKSLLQIKRYLSKLSFRTGVVVLVSCLFFYLLSFAVLAMPFSAGLRGALWTVFFGLAKTTQYTGLIILGAEGVKRLRKIFTRKSE